jgi:hypothetical protein
MQWAHFGAVFLGPGDVVDVEAVFRTHIAADIAITQMHTRSLTLAVGVNELS